MENAHTDVFCQGKETPKLRITYNSQDAVALKIYFILYVRIFFIVILSSITSVGRYVCHPLSPTLMVLNSHNTYYYKKKGSVFK